MAERKLLDCALGVLRRGTNLIEASAGTGKTYAISMLVLRLVTEYGIPIDEILLVTYTRAATEELATRIRSRLAEARDLLLGKDVDPDETLRRWFDGCKDQSLALLRLRTALQDIDCAMIVTIHGFCQRMLQEQALESGNSFDLELRPDLGHLHLQLARDYWRKTLYQLDSRSCSAITTSVKTPEMLLAESGFRGHAQTLIEPEGQTVELATQSLEKAYHICSQWWQSHGEALGDSFALLIAEEKVKKLFREEFSTWWMRLCRYLKGESPALPENLELLTSEGFLQAINGNKVRGGKKQQLLDTLALPDNAVNKLLEAIATLRLSFRYSFYQFFLCEIDRLMQRNRVMSYDDIIVKMYHAVTPEPGIRSKGHMVKVIQNRYRAALIDEFQDTDGMQWSIFSALFGQGKHYLYLIGDPKQAIYRFRGADIKTYFLAREKADVTLTLGTNYRSHPALVDETNDLFDVSENPFYYPRDELDFSPVDAAIGWQQEYLQHEGRVLDAVEYCQLAPLAEGKEGRWTSGKAAEQFRKFILHETGRLLAGGTTLVKDEEARPLQPRDIAVLVRSNRQAEEYQALFSQAGFPSVVASRQSIFATQESQDLLALLQYLANPLERRLFSRAIAIPWFGLTGNDIWQIHNDDQLLEEWTARFQEYATLWSVSGFLVMMRSICSEQKVFYHVGRSTLAERSFANIYHLMDLIAEEEADSGSSPVQVVQWLTSAIHHSAEEELRLESDEEAIRIITMHGAKGLEYPVVFCPYLWYRRKEVAPDSGVLSCFEEGRLVIDLGSTSFDARRERVAMEERAEDLRLLYVALTRARLRLYVMWADVTQGRGNADSFTSSLGHILFAQNGCTYAEQSNLLANRSQRPGISYRVVGVESNPDSACPGVEEDRKFSCRTVSTERYTTHYQVTSYSSLAYHHESIEPEFDLDGNGEEGGASFAFAELPAGAAFGNVIHDLLERLFFRQWREPARYEDIIEESCLRYGVEADVFLLGKMLTNAVSVPLLHDSQGTFCLGDLAPEHCVKEMGFHYHLQKSSAGMINEILKGERTCRPIAERTIQGFLTGFIDLVFQRNGRFYIVDYKTNHLGSSSASYSSEKLSDAMFLHNYGLQYWLYTMVVHRYLANRLEGYEYDDHFGGVFYLFLRGLDANGNGIYFTRPHKDTLSALEQCFR